MSACPCGCHNVIDHSARRLHELRSRVLAASWVQAGAEAVPEITDEWVLQNLPDVRATAVMASMVTHTLSYGSTLDECLRLLDQGRLSLEEWKLLESRCLAIWDEGLDKVAPANRPRLQPAWEQIRALMARVAQGGVNPIAASDWLLRDYLPMYRSYEFLRLIRTEAAYADNVARNTVFRETLGANSEAMDAVADAQGLTFRGPPVHPNCLCGTDCVLGTDGRYHLFLNPAPSACWLCQQVADLMLDAIPLVRPAGASPIAPGGTTTVPEPATEPKPAPAAHPSPLPARPAWDEASAKAWNDSLTQDEDNAFQAWLGSYYRNIRAYQATGDPGSGGQFAIDYSDSIEGALARAPQFQGTVYRGLADLSDEQMTALEAGELTCNAVTSASTSRDTALRFTSGRNMALLTIRCRTAADITARSTEGEVVLLRGTRLRLVSSERVAAYDDDGGPGQCLLLEYEELD